MDRGHKDPGVMYDDRTRAFKRVLGSFELVQRLGWLEIPLGSAGSGKNVFSRLLRGFL